MPEKLNFEQNSFGMDLFFHPRHHIEIMALQRYLWVKKAILRSVYVWAARGFRLAIPFPPGETNVLKIGGVPGFSAGFPLTHRQPCNAPRYLRALSRNMPGFYLPSGGLQTAKLMI